METSIGVCRDEPVFSTFGMLVRGYAYGEVFVITWTNQKISRSLWIHELSHHVLNHCEKYWLDAYIVYQPQAHHTFMKVMNLGH